MNRNLHRGFVLLGILLVFVTFAACRGRSRDSSGVDRYNRGVAFLEAGEYKNAITEFEAALRADPYNFEARKNLAGAYALEGNWLQARDNYLDARDMRPRDPSIYANLAQVYKELGEFELAWENIEKAMECDSAYPLAHYRAGELFMAQGMEEEAKAAFGDYLRLEPGTRLAQEAELILATLDLAQESEVSESTALEESAVEAAEEEIAEEELVAEEEATGEEEIAGEGEIPAEEEVTEAEEPAAEEAVEEESAEEQVEEPVEEEAEEVEEVVETPPEPELPELTGDDLYRDRLRRGRQMRAIGSTEAAISLLLEAYQVHPDYAQVNYELGMTYLLDGQTDQARTYLEKYLELETDPELRAEVEARLEAIEGGGSEEEDGGSEESEDGIEFF